MKILYVVTVGATMCFFSSLIRELLDDGHTVDIACNAMENIPSCYREWNCKIYPVSWERSPFRTGTITAIRELSKIVQTNHYDIVHCHTPVAAACTRLACRKLRKQGLKVIYTAHGFHFYRGAPFKNWLLYFPVEWICSWWTDVLITINREDYQRAKKRLHAQQIVYVPGVGIDTKKFSNGLIDKEEKRKELGIAESDIMILSVGELSERKNHEVVIKAISRIKNPHMKYFIAGNGEREEQLKRLAEQSGVDLHLMGYRTDISELCQAADLFVFPSKQEGLPVSLMEAIACKTPVICSAIRGNKDLVSDFLFADEKELVWILNQIRVREDISYISAKSVEVNYKKIRTFDLSKVEDQIRNIYKSDGGGGVVLTQLERLIYKCRLENELGIPYYQRTGEYKVIISIGELNRNKNHASVIRALSRLKNKKWRYYICGSGKLYLSLQNLIRDLNLSNQIYLLGYRTDVADLYRCADLFLFPSFREGLSVSLMEAIAAKVPVVCSRIRGNIDLVEDGLFDPHSTKEMRKVIEDFLYCSTSQQIRLIEEKNFKNLEQFNIHIINKTIYKVYTNEKNYVYLKHKKIFGC